MESLNKDVEWRLKWLWYSCGILLLLLVAIVSLIPVSGGSGNDKLAHLIIYLLLSSWFSLIVSRATMLWRVLFGLIAYGLLMEFLQGLTDYRSLEFADAVANSIGVIIGLLFHFSPFRRWLMAIDLWLNDLRH